MKSFIFLGTFTLSLMLGCSTVSVDNQWRDPSFAGPPLSNVLVVAITRSDIMKRVFEDVFSQELQAAGVRAERQAKPHSCALSAVVPDRLGPSQR